ncbi:MAG: marine proteobacterial sortase target protein [Litorimonas sp.]
MSFRRYLFISTLCVCTLGTTPSAFANNAKTATETALQKRELTPRTIKKSEAHDGSLLFKTDVPGRYIKAPSVKTDVDINIAGPVIRTTVSQSFQNNSDGWVEGIYVFPLPENAAVDRLRMVVGGRLIEGQIKEKQAAKKIYETAKHQGRKASLVEQERANVFTASVANIGPRDTVSIQIEYQDTAEIKNGVASMVFPMVVAPRYSPEPEALQLASADGGTVTAILDPVLDRHRITPPLMSPKDEPTEYIRLPVSIDIHLEAGFDIEEITSPYHKIDIDTRDEDSATIRLSDDAVPANRDFKLTWKAAYNRAPQKSIFKEIIGDDTYLMSVITPPKQSFVEPVTAHNRESIFVIDTSGSMGGTSIEQAREALKLGLARLKPTDSFNVIRFSSDYSSLYNQAKTATPDNVAKALRWVEGLEAGGGTQMMPAMLSALRGEAGDGRLKQVIFITDGAIGNEQQLFALIQDELNSARLFPVGIGSAPNRYFMSRAAKFGRGTAVVIGNVNEVKTQMGDLFAALENPVLTNLQLSLNTQTESYPASLPDLYEGEPVVSVTKVASIDLPKSIGVQGDYPNAIWQDSIDLNHAQPAKGLSVIWARRKIADLEERRFDRASAKDIDTQILSTALKHHLVTRLTSLVAVDITPSRDVTDLLQSQKVPTMLPEGWDFAALNSSGKQDALSHRQTPAQIRPALAAPSLQLPNTASPHMFLGLLGLIMLAFARLFRPQRRERSC